MVPSRDFELWHQRTKQQPMLLWLSTWKLPDVISHQFLDIHIVRSLYQGCPYLLAGGLAIPRETSSNWSRSHYKTVAPCIVKLASAAPEDCRSRWLLIGWGSGSMGPVARSVSVGSLMADFALALLLFPSYRSPHGGQPPRSNSPRAKDVFYTMQ